MNTIAKYNRVKVQDGSSLIKRKMSFSLTRCQVANHKDENLEFFFSCKIKRKKYRDID